MLNTLNNIDISKLRKISYGLEYDVYALNDESVLKISRGNHFQNSGKVLEDLQGLPFIPRVYEYGDDWLIMQRIQGNMLFGYGRGWSWFRVEYDYYEHESKALEFINGCIERGWLPEDMSPGNVMYDINGEFWVVDVGSFRKDKGSNFPTNQYQQLLRYGEDIKNAYELIQKWIDLLGEEKMYEICHPNYNF